MKRTWTRWSALAWMLCGTLLGCGSGGASSKPTAPPAPPPLDPYAFLPADAYIVADLDLQAFDKSPYVQWIVARIKTLEESSKQAEPKEAQSPAQPGAPASAGSTPAASPSGKAGKSPTVDEIMAFVRHGKRLVVGFSLAPAAESGEASAKKGTAVLTGTFAEGELERLAASGSKEPTKVTVGGYRGLRSNDGGLILRLDAHTYLIAPDGVVDAAFLDRGRRGQRPAVLADPVFQAHQARVGLGRSDAAVVAVWPKEARGRGVGTFANVPGTAVQAMAGRLALQSGISIEAVEQLTTPAEAQQIATALRTQVREAISNPIVRAVGLAPALRSVSVASDKAEVRVSSTLSDKEVRALLEDLESAVTGFLRGIAEGIPKQDEPGKP